uniref:Uncharacterized protein n=1 Tax=Arundo donax TaxID=35708 RepID=A0A0A9H6I2_ARUDO
MLVELPWLSHIKNGMTIQGQSHHHQRITEKVSTEGGFPFYTTAASIAQRCLCHPCILIITPQWDFISSF